RRLLALAVPQMVPVEDWFRQGPADLPAFTIEVPPGHAAERPAGAASPRVATAPVGRARVSLSMIVKNEEANLPHCLGSVADLVDEIVLVDTGSADRTKEVAAQFGARVHDFPWADSFGAARNESLRHCTGQWV